MPQVIVQKFGGPLLASAASRALAAERVVQRLGAGERVVVVVSAMGRDPDPYATDALRTLVPPPQDVQDLEELDLLMSCGEVISAVVFAQTLRARGVKAASVGPQRVGIITTPTFGSADILSVDGSYMRTLLANGVTPVVPGFIGSTEFGATTTLGRGGSDTTAAALAAELGASFLELFKDVGAIHDADPKDDPAANALPQLSYEELAVIANTGASQPVHADALAIAKNARLRVIVRGLDDSTPTLVS